MYAQLVRSAHLYCALLALVFPKLVMVTGVLDAGPDEYIFGGKAENKRQIEGEQDWRFSIISKVSISLE